MKRRTAPGMRSIGRSYAVRLRADQDVMLLDQADAARSLWNFLHAYHEFHANRRVWPSWKQMDQWVRDARHEVDWLERLPAQAAQQVIRQYRQGWENYWGATHERPAWKSRKARRGVDVPQARDLALTRLNRKWWSAQIPKVGVVQVRVQQALPERITGARLVREAHGWRLIVRGEDHASRGCSPNPLSVIGLDRGVVHTLADSNGVMFDQPATITAGEKRRLYRLERKSARQRAHRARGARQSNREKRTYTQIAVLRACQARRREDFAHQATARILTGNMGTVALEALPVQNMTASAHGTVEQPGVNVTQKAGLNRSILDQGWGQIQRFLTYKAAWSHRQVVEVPAAYSSQECYQCRCVHRGNRESQAVFRCTRCGWVGNADTNAARVIARRGELVVRRLEESSLDVEPIAIRRAGKRQTITATPEALRCAA